MYTVTFYSYKGGVGRTLALANVAYTLATEGGKKRVVVVDFDLEAPGIDSISPFDRGKRMEKGGVVEYIAEYFTAPEPNPDALPSLLPYAREVDSIPNLMLIPAGKKDEEYQKTLTCLNWDRFYRVQKGYRFFEQFKRKIEQELAPDYLLVDSRTGLADVAGITTHQLADLVVLVFNLNRQNLDGTKRCYDSMVSAARPRPIKIMLVASPIPQGHLLDAKLVESRLEDAVGSMPDVVTFGQSESDRIIQIPYHPALSLMDEAFVQAYPNEEISRMYRRIAEAVQKSNPAEMKFLLERAFRYRDENRFEEAEAEFCAVIEQHPNNAEGHYLYGDFLMKREKYAKATGQFEEACRLVSNNPRYLYALGTALAAVNRNDSAMEKLKQAESIEPGNKAILQSIARLFSKMGESTKALEYWRKINSVKPPASRLDRIKALQRFTSMAPAFLSSSLSLPKDFDRNGFLDRLEKALIFDYPTKASLLQSILNQSFSAQQVQDLDDLLKLEQLRLSNLLGDYFALVQSKVRQGELHDVKHEKDLERLIASTKGDDANAFRLCLAIAKMNSKEYEEVVDVVATALGATVPESCQAVFYSIWGDAIIELAEQADAVKRKAELLYEAAEKYARAVEIKPDMHNALRNWGIILRKLSDLHEGSEREALLKEAVEKFARAIEIKPDEHEVLDIWGAALLELSYLYEGRQKTAILKAALHKAKSAEELKPGAGIYNMACAYALLGQKRKAIAALKKAIESNPKHKEMAAADEDFLSLREDKAFKAIFTDAV
jgi:tetratricopeptide (TPR) repeat protein